MWYLITWFDRKGNALKCEVLHRNNPRKVWAFVKGRITANSYPFGAMGFWIREAIHIETIDQDYNEPRIPSNHAEDLGTWDGAPEVHEVLEPQQVKYILPWSDR